MKIARLNVGQILAVTMAVLLALAGVQPVVAAEPAAASDPATLTRERVNKVGRGRYVAADDFRVNSTISFSQPDYKFESRLPQGFGRATAKHLGVAGKRFWNEYPGIGAALVVMAPETVLIYDTVSRVALYVTGCHREGKKGGLNRIKEENPPQPELTSVPSVVPPTELKGELKGSQPTPTPTPTPVPTPMLRVDHNTTNVHVDNSTRIVNVTEHKAKCGRGCKVAIFIAIGAAGAAGAALAIGHKGGTTTCASCTGGPGPRP